MEKAKALAQRRRNVLHAARRPRRIVLIKDGKLVAVKEGPRGQPRRMKHEREAGPMGTP
jgi:hypothetical protein